MIGKFKSELNSSRKWFKEILFWSTEGSFDLFYNSFQEANDIAVEDIVKTKHFLVTQGVKTQELKNAINRS